MVAIGIGLGMRLHVGGSFLRDLCPKGIQKITALKKLFQSASPPAFAPSCPHHGEPAQIHPAGNPPPHGAADRVECNELLPAAWGTEMKKRVRYLTVGLLIASMLATLLLFLNCFVDWSPELTVNQLLEHYNNSIAILCGLSLVLQFIAFVVIASNRSS